MCDFHKNLRRSDSAVAFVTLGRKRTVVRIAKAVFFKKYGKEI